MGRKKRKRQKRGRNNKHGGMEKRKTSEGNHAMAGTAKEILQKRKFERNEKGRKEEQGQQKKNEWVI